MVTSELAIKWCKFMGEIAWDVGMPDAGGVVQWREVERVVVVMWDRRVVHPVLVAIWRKAAWVVAPPAMARLAPLRPEVEQGKVVYSPPISLAVGNIPALR